MKLSNVKISRARIASPVDYDVHFSDVVLLLHMDGANASTTFTDSSPTPKTVTANGNAQISTAQSKFGGAGGYFDGNGDALVINETTDLNLGNGNFTIEFWIYVPTTGINNTYGGIIASNPSSYGTNSISLWKNAAHEIKLGGTLVPDATWAIVTPGTWEHFALTRNGNDIRSFKNGVSAGTATWGPTNEVRFSSAGVNTTIGYCNVGFGTLASPDARQWLHSYIDDLRITKGVARYTGNFTPPTRAFPDYGGRVLFSNTVNTIPTIPISDVAFFSNTVNNVPTDQLSDSMFFSNVVNDVLTVASPTAI